MAEDVRNYLHGNPLIAGPESRVYRARKFVRRNQRGVVASATMLLILTLGITFYLHNIRAEQHRTEQEKQRAQTALIDAKRQQEQAQEERDNAKATLAFLTDDILTNATPEKIPDAAVRDQLVRAMITPAAETVGERFKDRPLIEASVRDAIAKVLRQVGRSDLALPHARATLSICQRVKGKDDPMTLAATDTYAIVVGSSSSGKLVAR